MTSTGRTRTSHTWAQSPRCQVCLLLRHPPLQLKHHSRHSFTALLLACVQGAHLMHEATESLPGCCHSSGACPTLTWQGGNTQGASRV